MVAKNDANRSVVVIHYTKTATGVVREGLLEDVANGDECAVDNSLDSDHMPLSPAAIVQRARSRVSGLFF